MTRIPDIRQVDIKWFVELFNEKSNDEINGNPALSVRPEDIEKVATRFGLTRKDFDWPNGKKTSTLDCPICESNKGSEGAIPICYADRHNRTYDAWDALPMKDRIKSIEESIIYLSPEERKQRDLLVKGVVS